MSNRRTAATAGLIACVAGLAMAQEAPVASDRAAMERLQREADGPMRRIREAAKLKVAPRPPEAVAPVPAELPAASALAASAPTSRSLPGVARRTAEPEAVISTLPPEAAAALPEGDARAVPMVEPVVPVEVVASAPALLPMPPAIVLAGLPPPHLVSKVDPELPARVYRRGGLRTEIVVDLVVATDGSVQSAAVRPGTSPDLEAPVLEAVRQWHYEPQPVARPHVVRLVVTPSS